MADQIKVGRRKTAVARVILRSGNGSVIVNGKEFERAFPQKLHRDDILNPLRVTNNLGKFDVVANVKGGGLSGQAQAIRLGIARYLVNMEPELRTALKPEGYLRRDPRMVERKKYGQPKARKRFQFSKR